MLSVAMVLCTSSSVYSTGVSFKDVRKQRKVTAGRSSKKHHRKSRLLQEGLRRKGLAPGQSFRGSVGGKHGNTRWRGRLYEPENWFDWKELFGRPCRSGFCRRSPPFWMAANIVCRSKSGKSEVWVDWTGSHSGDAELKNLGHLPTWVPSFLSLSPSLPLSCSPPLYLNITTFAVLCATLSINQDRDRMSRIFVLWLLRELLPTPDFG